jgi:hypothetical protein
MGRSLINTEILFTGNEDNSYKSTKSTNSYGEIKMNNGENMWNSTIWDRIKGAVAEECERTKVAAKFLPPYPGSNADMLTVPSDTVIPDGRPLSVNQNQTTDIIEILVEFKLTKQQCGDEGKLMTAVTLATRAANMLSQAEDVLIFQGKAAVEGPNQHPLFREGKVTVKADGDAGTGLLSAAEKDIQRIEVKPQDPDKPKRYGEETTAAVFEAYAKLQSGIGLNQAHYGPYALVLHNEPYADTFRPLEKTLIMPADRIKPLMTEGWFYGTGTLTRYTQAGGSAKSKTEPPGILVSLGGNTMDFVMAQPPMTEILQQEKSGDWLFRVYERFALRLKDSTAVIRLDFV